MCVHYEIDESLDNIWSHKNRENNKLADDKKYENMASLRANFVYE